MNHSTTTTTTTIDNNNDNNDNSESNESGDEIPTLPQDTLSILQSFLSEKESKLNTQYINEDNASFDEDWQLSQFWYNEETSNILVNEILEVTNGVGQIACVSTPSVFRTLFKRKSNLPPTLHYFVFEYDRRFEVYGDKFVFYDYNEPTTFPAEFLHRFDMIIVDPPFLSLECLLKVSLTINSLAKIPPNSKLETSTPVILLTGRIQEPHIRKLLPTFHICAFEPTHQNRLTNPFFCCSNYKSKLLGIDEVAEAEAKMAANK